MKSVQPLLHFIVVRNKKSTRLVLNLSHDKRRNHCALMIEQTVWRRCIAVAGARGGLVRFSRNCKDVILIVFS